MLRLKTSTWFFLGLLLLGTIAIVVPIVYNLKQQLTPEQLAEARERWRRHGPDNYDLTCRERRDTNEEGDLYEVKVRAGRVTDVRFTGKEPRDRDAYAV